MKHTAWEEEFDNEVDRLIARSMRDPSCKPLTEIKAFIAEKIAQALTAREEELRLWISENRKGDDYNEKAGRFGGYIEFEQLFSFLNTKNGR